MKVPLGAFVLSWKLDARQPAWKDVGHRQEGFQNLLNICYGDGRDKQET